MKYTKYVVKVSRTGAPCAEYVQRIDRKPVQTDGIVLRADHECDSEGAEIGIRFADTQLVDSVRIATYCYL